MTADTSPLSSAWVSPRDAFRSLAERSRRNPEAVALAARVAEALDGYLAGDLTLREFARRHTPFERFRAVRVWGPDDPHFAAIMPVLDELIALQRSGKAEPPATNRAAVLRNVPTAATSGIGYDCAVCGEAIRWIAAGMPLLCGRHKDLLIVQGLTAD